MTASERQATLSLASLYGLRMLGLFLVLPVFALEAARYPGGGNAAQVGLAFGVYGLTQALLQIPFGMASDRWGRKPVIVFGLLLFAFGSWVAATAATLDGLLVGRALQGSGAISAALTALLADLTRPTVRTKALALVGITIALMFASSLVFAPMLNAAIGLRGLFLLTAGLAIGGIVAVMWWVPPAPSGTSSANPLQGLRLVLRNAQLLRLDFGVFSLHAVQLAMWMAVPEFLVQTGLLKSAHWYVYLPALLASVAVLGGVLFRLERRGYVRAVMLMAIGCLLTAQLGFYAYAHTGGAVVWESVSARWALGVLLFVFFIGFNALEATQPSLASKLVEPRCRGAALGVFNTSQSLGFFVGGSVGGALIQWGGPLSLFGACAAWLLIWLGVASGFNGAVAKH